MIQRIFFFSCILTVVLIPARTQDKQTSLSVHMGELTAPDFIRAVEQSGGTCLIPAGILEKHGAHLPLSTDLLTAREISKRAAGMEYTIIFPEYYFGQIFEAKHQPGTIAYSSELIWKILEETCEELSRNGIKKIVIVNGHGGNNHFFAFFCQAQLAARKDYIVVLFSPDESDAEAKISALKTTDYGGHADEEETSVIYSFRPDLVHADRATSQSGRDMDRLAVLPYGYTGIWWYASYPNHYAGDGSDPKQEIGEILLDSQAEQLAALIRYLKEEHTIEDLQNRFFEESEQPLKTAQ
jgi:creatinine amidohydrolase